MNKIQKADEYCCERIANDIELGCIFEKWQKKNLVFVINICFLLCFLFLLYLVMFIINNTIYYINNSFFLNIC